MRTARHAVIAAVLVLSAACGFDGEPSGVSAGSGRSYDLPYGITAPEGSVAVGRPAHYDTEDGSRLIAAYRIVADDPAAVMQAWIDQFERSELRLGEVSAGRGGGGPHDPWLWAGGDDGDHLDVQLWSTEGDPVLLVEVSQRDGSATETVGGAAVDAGDEPDSSLAWEERTGGDTLFSEQGDTIHLPDGATAEMPTVPIFAGTGGSFSVFSAPDAEAAVKALLDEAGERSSYGEVSGPHRRDDGPAVVTGDFVIMAGGWSFDVVAIQAADDDLATVYVTSAAD